MESVENHKFIVFCGHGHNALGIIRSLHEKNIKPVLIVNKNGPTNYAERSRFVGEKHYADSSWEALELLLNEYGNEKDLPFVFTTDDYHAELLDKNYDRLAGRFHFFHCGQGLRLTAFLNKDEQCRAAEMCGFNVPEREVVQRGELPKTLQYPIITKTINSNEGGWKRDVYLCRDENELKEAYEHITARTLLLERFVEKKCEITLQGISINGGEQVYIPCYSEDYSFADTSFGNFLRYQTVKDEALLNPAVRLIRHTGFSGLFGMDLAVDQTDRLVFFEVNLRSDGKNYAATAGGANLPYLWATATLNNSIQTDLKLKESYYAVDEVSGFMSVVSHRKKMADWIADIKKADLGFWYYKHDNGPLRLYVSHKISNGIKKCTKR